MPIFWLLFGIGALGICTVGFLSFGHLSGHLGHSGHSSLGHGGGGHAGGQHAVGQRAKISQGDLGASSASMASVPVPGHTVATPVDHVVQQEHLASNGGFFKSNFVKWSVSHFLITPVDIFAYCFGAGVAGLVLESIVPLKWLVIVAILGALIMRYGILQPIMGSILKFASKPSDGLEGLVSTEAIAESSFNKEGHGLVQLKLDGQIRQVLGKLDSGEISRYTSVSKGDKLIVLEVDPKRNVCIVSRELAVQTSIP